MSRIAKKQIELPSGVEFSMSGREVSAKGPKGSLTVTLHDAVEVTQEDNVLTFAPRDSRQSSLAVTGTMRSVVNNIIEGVVNGFEKKLLLVGVGYRAQAQGKNLNLTLGFSHPVVYVAPDGISIEAPSQTEVIIKGTDKQQVGQVAAEIRRFRPPEPYKGKGVRYANERVVLKEAKKK